MVISLYASMVCCVSAAVPSGVNLSDLANWDIIIAENASPSEVYAAGEFQSHFAQASSVRLPIVRQPALATGGQRHIFIGSSSAIRYFVANNAIGIFMQAAGNALGAELSDLRNYVMAKSSIEPALAKRMRPLVKHFLDLCEKYGVTNASERGRIEDEAKRLKRIVGL